jgi:hypothetical protein
VGATKQARKPSEELEMITSNTARWVGYLKVDDDLPEESFGQLIQRS